jgi:hypothetical protein
LPDTARHCTADRFRSILAKRTTTPLYAGVPAGSAVLVAPPGTGPTVCRWRSHRTGPAWWSSPSRPGSPGGRLRRGWRRWWARRSAARRVRRPRRFAHLGRHPRPVDGRRPCGPSLDGLIHVGQGQISRAPREKPLRAFDFDANPRRTGRQVVAGNRPITDSRRVGCATPYVPTRRFPPASLPTWERSTLAVLLDNLDLFASAFLYEPDSASRCVPVLYAALVEACGRLSVPNPPVKSKWEI